MRTVKKDYYSVLVRAASTLDPSSPESRRALYDRARDAMAGAPLTASEIRQERFALEAAIRKIEVEFADASRAVPSLTDTRDQTPDRVLDAAPPTNRAASKPARRWSHVLVSGLAAATILVVGFAGYQYWRKAGAGASATLAQAPARDIDRGRSVGASDEKSSSYILKRQFVYYRSIHPVGTIVITKSQNFLYLIRPNTAALRYTIGIGRECSNVVGLLLVSAKEDWTGSDLQTRPSDAQPAVRIVDSRFGARSLALGDTGHRIHGSTEPVTRRVIGCFPLVNDDVVDLYERVALGARVVMN
jgi:lipoprotein-anchoring transpeptidase ErfK/SrfK